MTCPSAGSQPLLEAVERLLDQPVVSSRAIGGGCIHEARLVELERGGTVFVKGSVGASIDLFEAEAAGLEALARTETVRVPSVLAIGSEPPCLVLEAIRTGPAGPGLFEELGRGLAALHRRGASDRFGYSRPNYLGATEQPNDWDHDWVRFFRNRRLGYQLRLARARGLSDPELDRLGERLLERLGLHLAAPDEPPSLIHGDLWSSNYLADCAGRPVLIDPAVYYARREAELGMMVLFGGFPEALYRAYDEAWPLAPGWQERVQIYKLYHLLNHLNLFGESYRAACIAIMRRFA